MESHYGVCRHDIHSNIGNLRELKFGEGCFSYADEVSEEMPNGTLRVAACPALKRVTIGGCCCTNYSGFSLEKLPALETLTIGSRESAHFCGSFFHAELHLEGSGVRAL